VIKSFFHSVRESAWMMVSDYRSACCWSKLSIEFRHGAIVPKVGWGPSSDRGEQSRLEQRNLKELERNVIASVGWNRHLALRSSDATLGSSGFNRPMRKVLWYSMLLTAGLIGSQVLAGRFQRIIELLTLFCLSFVVVHLGYGFEVARDKPKVYLWDSIVGATTTVFPWLFCAIYFVFAMAPAELWWTRGQWWEAVLLARFAAPTSVGLLFAMLAAAGLSATWIYRKARVLAIFDDLDTILLFIPLKRF